MKKNLINEFIGIRNEIEFAFCECKFDMYNSLRDEAYCKFDKLEGTELIVAMLAFAGYRAESIHIYNGIDAVVNFYDRLPAHKRLRRWGGDFAVTIKDGKIVENTLAARAWNWDEAAAKKEADSALVYFARNIVEDYHNLAMDIEFI